MDSPQGPHQPTQSNWMYMQHLLQQLQDHQQPPQPQQHQQQHHLQHPPPPPSPHQQQQQPPPPATPPHQPPPTSPPQPPHQLHPIRQQPPLQPQPQPPPSPHTQPHHHNPHHHHPHHQTLPQHHQTLQMPQMSSQPQQYQHHQQQYKPPPPQPQPQQQYKAPPPPQQQQQQASKQYLRTDDHSYSVESLLGNSRVEVSQPLLPTPVHPTALLPTPSYPPPLLPRVFPAPLLSPPMPAKIQPDNEMMVMSFLNELEGGKKVPSSATPPTPSATLHKPLPPTPTSSFSQVLATHPPLHPHLAPTTPHLVLPSESSIPTTATTTTRVNHNGNTPGLHINVPHISPLTHNASPPQDTPTPTTTATTIRMQHPTPMTHEASPPQESMPLNPVYPGNCEGDGNGEGSGGAPMVRLERGDSASSMSQLDLALSDDSNPLLDQLESALESDSSIQAKASPEGPVPPDASCCSEDAREVEGAAKDPPSHPQTEMFMSLLDAPSDAARHAPLQPQSPQQPPPPSHTQAMLTTPSRHQDKGMHPEASEKVPGPCRSPLPDTTKEDARGSPIVAQIVPLCAPTKPAQDTHKVSPKVKPVAVQITSPSGDRGSPEDTHTEEDQASPTAAAAGPSVNTKDVPTAPKSPEEVSVVSPGASPVPDTPPREPSPPKDTPESSQDIELVAETISEDSVQALTDTEAPSSHSEAKQDTAQDSTPKATSGPSKGSAAAAPAPEQSEEGNSSEHEITTVYIIEPKQENFSTEKQVPEIVEVTPEVSDEDSQQQQQQPQPQPQVKTTAPEKEGSSKQDKQDVIEVSPGRVDKQAALGGQLELRTKRVRMPRKETHFFEPTVVPPESQKLMVMCYVCDTNVKVAKLKHHLFFGFVRCHYCNRRLMGCRLLMEDLNNPEKSVCFSSPSRVHSFSKWAGDPIEHLSYYIRKDLVIKRFCAGKTKPPPVPEIVAEIHNYISRLSVLESIGPWCYAFERCQKYIQERINAEPKAFDQDLRSSITASLAAHSVRLGPSSPMVDGSQSPSTEGSRPATSTPPQERTATPPVPQPAEDKESRTLPVIQAVTSEKVTVEPVIVMEPAVTQSEESADDPMETVDDPLSDGAEDAPPTPEAATPASTLPPTEATRKSSLSAEKPSEETLSRATPPPKAVPVTQTTISRLRDVLSGATNSSRRSSPSRSSRTSKTATPEPPPTTQSDVELVNDSTTTNAATTTAAITTTTITTRTAAITKKSIAGTTLIRQWGTKAKVHTPAVRRSTQGESWPVKNENYLIIKYPTEACPDLCPSCYTAFNPMQATVQCSSFLMTVRCESCKLTLFVSQDPPSPHPRKKRRL